MYESMTYDYILKQMLDRVPDTVDKREGSIIYDAIAPAAVELTNMYINLDTVLNLTFADTSVGEYLDRRCAERGLTRHEATCAIAEGVFTPTGVSVSGKRFNCGQYNYTVDDNNNLICETPGTAPNSITGQLIPIDYIDGLETASITEVLIPGEDAETDDSLRVRYFNTLSNQAFGGNVTDYKNRTNDIDGVGGCKVVPVWDGGGTVKVTIIASDYSVPTSTLISTVQDGLDYTAPIGHEVTVDGVTATTVNISTDITYQTGWSWESAKTYIEAGIDAYFKELNKTWADNDSLIVRLAHIETRLLSCNGVLDVANTAINGASANLQLSANSIPVRGVITDGA